MVAPSENVDHVHSGVDKSDCTVPGASNQTVSSQKFVENLVGSDPC